MKRATKLLALLLALMLLTALFAGCGKGGSGTSTPAASSGSSAPAPEPATDAPAPDAPPAEPDTPPEDDLGIHVGELPLVDEVTELTLWHTINPDALRYVNSYADNSVIKKADELTNVELVCTSIAGNLAMEQFPIMISGGEYSDMMGNIDRMYPGGVDAAIDEGVVIDTKPYLEKWAPAYWEALNSNPVFLRTVTTDAGHIGAFAQLATASSEDAGYMIRSDWAKEFNMDPTKITTYDQWYEYLKAANAKYGAFMYVNPYGLGNRQTLTDGYGISVDFSPMEGFGPFQAIDGVVSCSYTSDELQAYITMMAKWYSENLLWKDFPSGGEVMTAANSPCYTEFLNDKVGLMMLEMGNLLSQESNTGKMIELLSVPNPVLEEGQTNHISTAVTMPQLRWTISTSCEIPELACAYINYWFTDEGFELGNYGIEGEAYTVENGEKVWTDLIVANPDNIPMKALMTLYMLDDHPFLVDTHRTDSMYSEAELECSTIWMSNRDGAWQYPSAATMSVEENGEYGTIWNDVYTYAVENIPAFITGARPLTEWADYTAKLEELGIARLVEIKQAAYDRYLER